MRHCFPPVHKMKVGIGVDNWKLVIFRRELTAAGFQSNEGCALTHNTTLLTVETDDVERLKAVVEKCQAECRKKS